MNTIAIILICLICLLIFVRVDRVGEELKDVTKAIKEVGNQLGDVPKAVKGKNRPGKKPKKSK